MSGQRNFYINLIEFLNDKIQRIKEKNIEA